MTSAQRSPKKILFLIGWPLFFVLTAIGNFLYQAGMKYRFQMDWGSLPTPEWFDHEYDLAFFPRLRKAHFFERGVYLQEMLKKSYRVLDLCCGDGSVTALFISPHVESVVGVDFDKSAIASAQRRYSGFSNTSFRQVDIRNLPFKPSEFDFVTWDTAIEHFTQQEMDNIFGSIRSLLKSDGVLAGSTVARQEHLQHHDHEYEFESTAELETFLKRYFKNVYVWERPHADRRNFYFRCTDADLNLKARSV